MDRGYLRHSSRMWLSDTTFWLQPLLFEVSRSTRNKYGRHHPFYFALVRNVIGWGGHPYTLSSSGSFPSQYDEEVEEDELPVPDKEIKEET